MEIKFALLPIAQYTDSLNVSLYSWEINSKILRKIVILCL